MTILQLVSVCVFAPLIASIASYSYQSRGQTITFVTTLLTFFASLALLAVLPREGVLINALGDWPSPLGIQWRVDGLAALMIAMTNIVALAVSVYARDYFRNYPAQAAFFWPLWMMLLGGLNALYLSNDLFNWYVTLEIVGLSSVALVALAGTSMADRAALRYLLVSLVGSLSYLAGVALLYIEYSSLDLNILQPVIEGELIVALSLALMLGGLLLKSAIFPLHFWLAPAHSSAPAPVSALLSALVVKGSFYILIRIWLQLFPEAFSGAIDMVLGALGTTAIFWGSYMALRTPRLKLLVAYSTVAQLGYLALYFPLSGHPASAQVALGGLVYFIIAHGLAKAALFLAAGNLQKEAGHDDISQLGAAAARLPMTLFACALAGASLIGLPPSAGFIAKWSLLNASILSGNWFFTIVLGAGGLLSAAYIFRILALAFQAASSGTQSIEQPAKCTTLMQSVPLLLASTVIILGLNALPALNLLLLTETLGAGSTGNILP